MGSTISAITSDTTQVPQNNQVLTEDLQEPPVPERHANLERSTGLQSSEVKEEAQEIEEGPKFIQPDHL